MNPVAIRIRFWARILGLPWIWVPAVTGISLTLSGYSYGFAIGGALFSAVGIGYLLASERREIWAIAADDIRAEAQYQEQSKLRELRRLLRGDKDYRSNQCMRELQTLYDRMQHNRLVEAQEDDSPNVRDIKQQTWDLYRAGFGSLERSFDLWVGADQMTDDEASESLLKSRQDLLDEVNESLQHLGKALDYLQTRKLQNSDEDTLTDSSKELAQGLEVARNIQRRLDELERELHSQVQS